MRKILLFSFLILLVVPALAETTCNSMSSNSIANNYDVIITILVGILTILCSGVVASVISHNLAKSKEELFYKRKKLEELHKSIKSYTTLFVVTNFMWPKVMDGELTFNQGLDLQIGHKADDDRRYAPEIEMLLDLYFPIFSPTYKIFKQKIKTVNELYDKFREIYKISGPTVNYRSNSKEFANALIEVEKFSTILLKEVSQHAQKLT